MKLLGELLVIVGLFSAGFSGASHAKVSKPVNHVRTSDFAPDCPCKCPCKDGKCDCKPGKCECDKCPGIKPKSAYGAASAQALAERRGLVVWVGMKRDLAVKPGCVHVEVASGWNGITGPARVDSYYDAGNLYYKRVERPARAVARPVVRMVRGGNC